MEVECKICNEQRRKQDIVFSNDLISVKHYIKDRTGNHNYLGYYMIESTRHFKGMYDATEKEMQDIGAMAQKLSSALMQVVDGEHVYAFVMGDGVDHFHMKHILIVPLDFSMKMMLLGN